MSNEGRLALSDIGSFYVAHISSDDKGVDRAYVQYFIPEPARRLAVIFAHGGGGISGSSWETTPDGRPGWLMRFLRAGWPCYVVDNVGRGRAVVGQLPGVWEGVPTPRVDQQAWDLFRIGEPQDRASGTPFPSSQFPIDLLAQESEPSPHFPAHELPSVAALVAVARTIGRCAIVAHSGGARFTAEAAGIASDVIAASVLIEPHTLPISGPRDVISRQLLVCGDNLNRSAIWSKARENWHEYHAKALRAGAPVEFWELPSKGVHGNGHMMMMERNSDAIADLLMGWLKLSDESPNN